MNTSFSKATLHTILASLVYVSAIAGALVGYFNSTQTASILGVLVVVVAAVEGTKVNATKGQNNG